jgi:hypothetical protein
MCAVHPAWEAATQALRDSLSSVRLSDLVDVDAGLQSGDQVISPTAHRSR